MYLDMTGRLCAEAAPLRSSSKDGKRDLKPIEKTFRRNFLTLTLRKPSGETAASPTRPI